MSLPSLRVPPLVERAEAHASRIAIVDPAGKHTYGQLLDASAKAARALLAAGAPRGKSGGLGEARVAFVIAPGFEHVAVQWGIWRAGGIAVPLAVSHPPAEWEHVIRDSGAVIVAADAGFAEPAGPVAERVRVRFMSSAELRGGNAGPALPEVDRERPAMIVYTSGTTGRSKGVVTSHGNIEAQIRALIEAWGWTREDRALLVLPLHHVHGIINVVSCALWAGACCEMPPRFDAGLCWSRIAAGETTVFMAVPTIYQKLIAAWEAAPPEEREAMSAGCRRMRLMVSGSAALPVAVLERWREISGHVLLERYGMTELGMALSNLLVGERRPGFVGTPLPDVQVRLADDEGRPVEPGLPGQIEVRGATVFREYWGRPDDTRAAFRDGWFQTGDMAVFENGSYRILGRSSVDIIKTGGFKVSALEIEEELRTHPAVADCAVVGIPDAEWGERIGAAVELKPGRRLDLEELQGWARDRLAPYKIPRMLRCVEALPRNAMGKIIKPEVARLFPG